MAEADKDMKEMLERLLEGWSPKEEVGSSGLRKVLTKRVTQEGARM